jgi:hypothetical protein
MKVLLRPRIYALWDEKSTSGSSTYHPETGAPGDGCHPSVLRSAEN